MIMHLKILTVLGILAVIALATTHILNIQNMEEKGRDASSYHDISPYLYVFAGLVSIASTYYTYKFHFLAGILSYGIGMMMLIYGFYLLIAKGVIIVGV